MRISGVTYASRRRHSGRRIIFTVIILLLLSIIATIVLSGYKSWALMHPQKKPIDSFSSNIVPEYRDVSFKSIDKSIVLKGWFFNASRSDRAVILVHSQGSNRLQFGIKTIDLIKRFLGRGYAVFTFDLRNSGESGGKISTFGCSEAEDVKAAVNYISSQGIRHITLMGFSTGASASVLAAADSKSVDAVIADSPYADLDTYLSNNLDKWTNLPSVPFNSAIKFAVETTGDFKVSDASPLKALTPDRPAHMLLIHGRRDHLIPVENSEELYRKYSRLNPSGAEFWQTEADGDATSFLKYPDEYMDRVFTFLGRVYPQQ